MVTQDNPCTSRKTFLGIFVLSQFLSFFVLALFIAWECIYNKGFAWDYRYRQFAIHPLVMILAMVVIYGQGALSFRLLSSFSRSQIKYVHGALMGVTLILGVFGVATIFVFHNAMNDGNMYTMHSWCGMLTLVSFGLQFFFGLAFLSFSDANGKIRRMYLPIHRYGSFAILAMTAASIVSGVVDDIFLCMSNKSYRALKLHAVVFNVMGIISLISILTIMYLLYRNEWKSFAKKKKDPEIPEGDAALSSEVSSLQEATALTASQEGTPLLGPR